MKQLVACSLALGLCALASSAFAEDAAVQVEPPQREASAQPERRWYGWQTLTSDAASVGFLIGGIHAADGYGLYGGGHPGSDVLLTAGLAGYVGGGPALHFIHKRPAAAAGSIGLRLILPVLGGLISSGLTTCPRPGQEYGNCGTLELVMGVSAGAVAAVAIDAGLLSWSKVEAETPAARRLGFAPVISNDGKRGELRVFGTF